LYSLLWSKWLLHGEEGVGREKKEKRRRVFHGWVSRKWKGEVVRAARGYGPASLGRTRWRHSRSAWNTSKMARRRSRRRTKRRRRRKRPSSLFRQFFFDAPLPTFHVHKRTASMAPFVITVTSSPSSSSSACSSSSCLWCSCQHGNHLLR
jgi:hypothetical protein